MPITAMFDLWGLLVETIFGSVWASFFGLILFYYLMTALLRMSPMLSFYLLGMFSLIFLVGYIGAFALVPAFILSFTYFAYSIYRWWGGYSSIGT